MSNLESSTLSEEADVVVVGAGVAGLYCAWRLLETGKAKNVVIVERLNRTGGRLDTDLIKINEVEGSNKGKVATVRDEEGGMRFTSHMEELMAVNAKLGLCDQVVKFPMGPDPGKPNNNRRFIRGKRFTAQESSDANIVWSLLYNLADNENEQGKEPVDIIEDVYHKLVLENGAAIPENPTLEFWQRFRLDFVWKNIPLNQWQLWGLFRDMGYSEECVTMLSHAIGFEAPFLSLANAGEAFQILLDFPKVPNYLTFKKGYSTLPNALRKNIEKAGGEIHLGVNVEGIQSDDCNRFDLTLTVAPENQSASRFVDDGVTRHLKASKVILAVASKALTNIYGSSSIFNAAPNAKQIWEDLNSVVNMRLLKINLYFREAWWEDESVLSPPVQYGASFTDLPVNSIYPFYSLKGPDEQLPAALTIYCDFNNTNYWQGLQNVGPKFTSPLQEAHSEAPQVLFPASVAVVDEALKQIGQVYGIEGVPQPVMTSYRLWGGESDFGYAYHQWALNADDRGVMERMAEPVDGIYTCNEAYSDDQGWVNGSLRSADTALKRFGISPLVAGSDHETCTPKES